MYDFDVIIVGAGISGINFAYRLQERHPGLTYCILEDRHEIGGTWSLFQYPGKRRHSVSFDYSHFILKNQQASDQTRISIPLASHGVLGPGQILLFLDLLFVIISKNPPPRPALTKGFAFFIK